MIVDGLKLSVLASVILASPYWIAEVQSQVASEPVDAKAGIYGPYQLGSERVPEWAHLGFSSTSITIHFYTDEDVRKIRFVSLGHGYRMTLYVIQPDVEDFEPPYGYEYWEHFEKTKTAVSCLPREL